MHHLWTWGVSNAGRSTGVLCTTIFELCRKKLYTIEKELLAIVYGCTRFHQYVYGKKVRVETDHKSLEPLFKKPLFQALQRLQLVILRLQRYDLQVEYEPGKNLYIPDTLSRAPEGKSETLAN